MSATPANDMKPLHVEGGELLRDRTKDNNTPSVLGPFIRLFDGNFSLNDVRKIGICRRIEGDQVLWAGGPKADGRNQP